MEWLYATGSVEQALACSDLFWPEFVEHEGCVFMERVADSFRGWSESLGDPSKVEAMLNHRHICDLFERESSHNMMIGLGRVLRDAWTIKLARDFPERRFAVEFYDTPSENPTDYQITFYQVPKDI
jgi:hypothetical protein